jgi:aryl-alcohol dehydrogenase-like predicted oxidoreductase
MEYRELGRTGWKVSSISFGAWAIGGTWGQTDDDESMATLHRALDVGVNFFDMPEVFGVLDDLVRAGKLRHYGVSVEKVEEALKAIEYPNVQSVQIIYNILRQRPAERLFPLALKRRVGILARLPLSSGLLSGKLSRDTRFAADDHRSFNREGAAFDRGETFSGLDYEIGLQAVEALRPLVPPGQTLAQFALRWILMSPAVTCAIPGGRRPSQVDENMSASDLPPMSAQLLEQVVAVYERFAKPHVHHLW